MKNIYYSFLITFLAGFSTLFGLIPCFMKKKNSNIVIPFSLAFSAGVMLTISLVSLIPESLKLVVYNFRMFPACILVSIFIVIGIIFSMTIDQKIDGLISNNSLYKLGIISVIALILHNIPEGVTTFVSSSVDTNLGLVLAISIALHNIPEGISIAVPIYYSTGNIKKAFFYTLISGFSELFGAVIAYLFLAKYVNNMILSIILGVTAGIMLHISFYELLPNSFSYNKRKVTLLALIIGSAIMLLCSFVL